MGAINILERTCRFAETVMSEQQLSRTRVCLNQTSPILTDAGAISFYRDSPALRVFVYEFSESRVGGSWGMLIENPIRKLSRKISVEAERVQDWDFDAVCVVVPN